MKLQGKIILLDAWNTFVTEDGIFKELQVVLDTFENKKIIVTNANQEQKVKFGIVDMPYEVFSLSHNPDKTDPDYFKKLFEHFSLSAKDVVYVEHNKDALKAAEFLGIKSWWYDKDAKDVEKVMEFLQENISK